MDEVEHVTVTKEFSSGWTHSYKGVSGEESLVSAMRPSGEKLCYKGRKGEERMVSAELPDGSKRYYEGAKDNEQRISVVFPDGQTQFFEGVKGEERKVRTVFPSGDKHVYEGAKGQERLVGTVLPNGHKASYEGAKGKERLVKEVLPSGCVRYHEGAKGEEHKTSVVFPNGDTWYFLGAKGQEHVISVWLSNNVKQYYEGAKGEEHIVSIVLQIGDKHVYEGPRYEERMVYTVLSSGEKRFYEGAKDEERLVSADLPNGRKHLYEGAKGEERLVSVVFPSGQTDSLEGAKGQERLVRTVLPSGQTQYYEGAKGEERRVSSKSIGKQVQPHNSVTGEEHSTPFVDDKKYERVWEFVIEIHAPISQNAIVEGYMPLTQGCGHVPFSVAVDVDPSIRGNLNSKQFCIRVQGSPAWCNCREGLWPIMGAVRVNTKLYVVKNLFFFGNYEAENKQFARDYDAFYRVEVARTLDWKSRFGEPSCYLSSYFWNSQGEETTLGTCSRLNPLSQGIVYQNAFRDACAAFEVRESIQYLRTAVFNSKGWAKHPMANTATGAAPSSALAVYTGVTTVLGKRVAESELRKDDRSDEDEGITFVSETTRDERNRAGFDPLTNKALVDITED